MTNVVVPAEPTEEMIEAAEASAWDYDSEQSIRAMYAAMLSARPDPASVPGDGGMEIGAEYDAAAHCVTLAECPPGLFFWNGTLGFKSEYGAMEPDGSNFKTFRVGSRADAYCADSGEFFWGGTSNHEDRAKVLVYPIDAPVVAMVASHGPAALRQPAPAPDFIGYKKDPADLVRAVILATDDGDHHPPISQWAAERAVEVVMGALRAKEARDA